MIPTFGDALVDEVGRKQRGCVGQRGGNNPNGNLFLQLILLLDKVPVEEVCDCCHLKF